MDLSTRKFIQEAAAVRLQSRNQKLATRPEGRLQCPVPVTRSRSSVPELLAFHLASQEVVEYAELLGQGQRHLVLVIDSVRKGNSSLLNLKNINM